MTKRIAFLFLAPFFFSACSTQRQASVPSQPSSKKKDVKFLDDIEVKPDGSRAETPNAGTKTGKGGNTAPRTVTYARSSAGTAKPNTNNNNSGRVPVVENATALQLKYAILLDTEVEEVRETELYSYIDSWFGTRYCMGGTTKSCVDCSGFVQNVFSDYWNTTVPRTAREQYRIANRISATSLRMGDLIFFNTIGGVSHVGIYLQNNKFVHASSSEGVTISDMYEPYWVKHRVGIGRISH